MYESRGVNACFFNIVLIAVVPLFTAGCSGGLKHFSPTDGDQDDAGPADGLDTAADTDQDLEDVPGDVPGDAPGDVPEEEPACECTSSEECDDGLFCNGEESCDGCYCILAPGLDCDDHVDCTDDECMESIDDCQFTPNHDNCDEGHLCDPEEGCVDAPECENSEQCDNGY
ncbi:MAG: hypothetical protein ABIJ56_19680, partial [Pseudomonadota bacterium]